MVTNPTTPMRERHINHDNDYFMPKNIPLGYSAVRTRESGILDCMVDPGLPKDNRYVRFQTTNKEKNGVTLSQRNQSVSLPPTKPVVENEPYGQIVGKGTKRTKVDKLREVFGLRNPSADQLEQVKKAAHGELNHQTRSGKKLLGDGQKELFDSARKTNVMSLSPNKEIEQDPESDYIKVPCRFTGW